MRSGDWSRQQARAFNRVLVLLWAWLAKFLTKCCRRRRIHNRNCVHKLECICVCFVVFILLIHVVNHFLTNYSLRVKISIQTVPTVDSFEPNQDAVAFGRHDKHPQALLYFSPWNPWADFQAFPQSQTPMAFEKYICQKDRKHVDCCHFLIIKSVERPGFRSIHTFTMV